MSNSIVYYIYKIIDPRIDEVFYVGQTRNFSQRFASHNCCKKGALGLRIQEIKKANERLKFVVIEEATYPNGTTRERFWIDHYNSNGHKLLNIVTWNKTKKKDYDVFFDTNK